MLEDPQGQDALDRTFLPPGCRSAEKAVETAKQPTSI
jgi:hypothetical protein